MIKMTDLNWKGVCVCLMGEVRWRDVMRERHSLRLDQFRLGLMSPKLDDAPPSRSLPQNRIFHVKLPHTLLAWQQKLSSRWINLVVLILQRPSALYTDGVIYKSLVFMFSSPIFAGVILNILLSWVDCPNILSLDYSWCAEGSATGSPLARCTMLQSQFQPFPPSLRKDWKLNNDV